MKTIIFLAIVLVAGALAGTIHGVANLAIVEPYLDEAIGIENQNLFASGEEEDTPQFWLEYDAYRDWQKGGQVLAGAILGTSIGALFGIVYALSRKALPQGNDLKKTFVLAAVMWFSIYIIPFLKYPANPPTVGDGETVVLRAILYLSFIAISGFGVVGFYQVYKRMEKNKKIVAVAGYAAFIAVVFVLMPPNPDEITAPMDMVNGFRAMSVVAVSVFWVSLAFILGTLWNKFKPHSEAKLERH
ncbi:MAG: CbtA family protein [Nitrosopumilus sp.]|nr:CbtA family protein [Nitrosopumilus sp.]